MFQIESASDWLICKNSFWEGLMQYARLARTVYIQIELSSD